MKISNLISIIALTFAVALSRQQFSSYLDPWNSLVTIHGQFQKNHTLFKYATCDPCQYMVIVFKDYVQLLIDNPEQGKKDNVLAFQFEIQNHHFQQTLWDFDQHKFTLKNKKDIREVVERTSKKGLQWSYELTLPIEGLILKGHSVYLYDNLIPLVTFIFSILTFITFSFSGESRRQQIIQIPRRTPLISLIILAQLQHIILIQVIILMIKYLIYEESFLTKSFWYILYMIPFAFLTLQIVYIYDSIRSRYLHVFKKIQTVRLKDIGLVMIFFIGIYGGSIGLLLVGKGIWVFCYFALYLVWQITESLLSKTYPYLSMTWYYFTLLGYQMFLANFEPLFWFEQQTWSQIAIFWGILIIIFVIGSVLQRCFIGIQMVNQVLFEESKSIEMGDQASAKSTQVNLQT